MDTVTRKQIYDLYSDFVSRFSCDPVLVRNVRRTRQALEMANIESSNAVKDVPTDETSAKSSPASDSQDHKEEDKEKEVTSAEQASKKRKLDTDVSSIPTPIPKSK